MRLLALAVVVVAAAAGGVDARADFPSLFATYKTEDCTFTFRDDAGKTVHTIPPGDYQVVVATSGTYGDYYVSDQTGLRACKGFVGFRLTGPGVNLTTTLDYGDSSGEILAATFKPGGTYAVQDDHNVAGTKRTFNVATSGSVTVALQGVLTATVNAKGELALTRNDKTVSSLKQGKWTFSVRDDSRKNGFTLQRAAKSPVKVTDGPFYGFRDVTIILKPGQWSFYSPGGTKRTFRVVT